MAKPEQLLIIEPDTELKFRGPFNVSVLTYMRLTNPTDKKILFKIKTTAPKRYCVRPNSGVLDSKSTMEVAIALQPFVFDPNEKNKHKFMVQSLVAPEGDYDGDRLWKEISPEQLMDSKLKCVFELPVDNNTVIDLSSSKIKQTDGTTTDIISGKQEVSQLSSEPEKVGIKSGDPSYDYIKTNDEIRKLREEESQLRQENLELKEQLLKLKMASHSAAAASSSSATSGSSSGAAAQYQNPYAPPASANQQIPTLYIAIAIAIAIFGLLIGKFAL